MSVPVMPRILTGLCLALLAFTPSCVVGPDYEPPQIQTHPEFARASSDDEAGVTYAQEQVAAVWWDAFNTPLLDELIQEALASNLDIRVAEANLRASRELLGIERRELRPTIEPNASVEFRESSPAFFEQDVTFYSAAIDLTWELDLFGRVRRSIQAASAEYGASEADRRGMQVSVAGAVARSYIELTGARRRLQVAEANIKNQEQSLQLVNTLLDAGRGTQLDVERARSQLATTRATLPAFESAAAQALHRLAVLLGQQPGELDSRLAAAAELPRASGPISIGDPATLLRRRPDIAAAERRLAAATARIGIATADLFPRVSLNGSFGALALSADELADTASRQTSFGPFLRWTAFDLGQVRNRIRANEARTDAALAQYENTVLTALEETENALVDLDRLRERQAHLLRAQRASTQAAELARQRFDAGLDDFLIVLDAENRQLAAQDLAALGEIALGQAYVTLSLALGG